MIRKILPLMSILFWAQQVFAHEGPMPHAHLDESTSVNLWGIAIASIAIFFAVSAIAKYSKRDVVHVQ